MSFSLLILQLHDVTLLNATVACYMLHVACCMLHVVCYTVACCMLHVMCYTVACCMLCVTFCVLHVVYCMLHVACCTQNPPSLPVDPHANPSKHSGDSSAW